jgi:hypothetical protein
MSKPRRVIPVTECAEGCLKQHLCPETGCAGRQLNEGGTTGQKQGIVPGGGVFFVLKILENLLRSE